MDGENILDKVQRESYLYRVFRTDTIHNLEKQTFTYLGAEIFFTKNGKIYRYEEPVFHFREFHAFLKDKYENYQLDEFILITKEGQFNIRYFPYSEDFSGVERSPIDDIELLGFRMFPDLLPAGAELLLSVLDRDPMEDIEGNIEIFERLLRLIEGDRDPFLRIQVLMNLSLNYFRIGEFSLSKKYVDQAKDDLIRKAQPIIDYSRSVRKEGTNVIVGKDLLFFDPGYISVIRTIILDQLEPNGLFNKKIELLLIADGYWNDIGYQNSLDLFNLYFNLGRLLGLKKFNHNLAKPYYMKAFGLLEKIDQSNQNIRQKSLLYTGMGDYYNAIELIKSNLDDQDIRTKIYLWLNLSILLIEKDDPSNSLKYLEGGIKYLEQNETQGLQGLLYKYYRTKIRLL